MRKPSVPLLVVLLPAVVGGTVRLYPEAKKLRVPVEDILAFDDLRTPLCAFAFREDSAQGDFGGSLSG